MDGSFADAVSMLGSQRDGDIFVTRVARSGTRFEGFHLVDHGEIACMLSEHSQCATYTSENGRLVITCHPADDTTITPTTVAMLTKEPHNLQQKGDTLHGGAVSSHSFLFPSTGIHSNVLSGVVAHPRVVKVYVTGKGVRILQAHDRSINNGLVSTLQAQRSQQQPQPCRQERQRSQRAYSASLRRRTATSARKSSLHSSRLRTTRTART